MPAAVAIGLRSASPLPLRSMTQATNVSKAPEILMVASATAGEVVIKPRRVKAKPAETEATTTEAATSKPKATRGKTIDLTEIGTEALSTTKAAKAANGVSPTKTTKAKSSSAKSACGVERE